jgi:hypothetical protein
VAGRRAGFELYLPEVKNIAGAEQAPSCVATVQR